MGVRMAYEIRAMTFSEVLDTGFRLIRDHFALLVGIGLVLYGPLAIAQELLAGVQSPEDANATAMIVAFLFILGFVALSPIAQGAMTLAIGDVYRGRTMAMGDAFRGGLRRALPLVGTYLLYTLGVAIGIVLLVLPGIYLMVAWMLTTQVVMLEGLAGPAALGRSRELLKEHMLRALGIFIVAGIIVSVLQVGLDLVLSGIPVVRGVVSAIVQSVGLAFLTAVSVVLYFDLRCRKENFDLEHLARLVESGSPTAPSIR
jgi:hypothetical protein